MAVRPVLTVLVLHLFTAVAWAAPVAIENSGFEALYLGGNLPPQYGGDVPPTAFPTGAPPAGWQPYGAVGSGAYVGVLNPGVMAVEPMATNFPAGALEGDNVVLLFFDGHLGGAEFGVTQTLSATLTANTRYTLSAGVGNIASGTSVVQPYASFGFFDLRGFPGYRVELVAGGTVIAADNNSLLPAEGTFETSTVEAVIGASHAQLGQSLAIRLVNLNQPDVLDPAVDLEVDFDAIALDASPLAAGDFNGDNTVDAADFTVWRDGLGSTYTMEDYDVWKSHFGLSNGSGGSAGTDAQRWSASPSQAAVPEPGTWLGFVMIVAVLWARRSVGR